MSEVNEPFDLLHCFIITIIVVGDDFLKVLNVLIEIIKIIFIRLYVKFLSFLILYNKKKKLAKICKVTVLNTFLKIFLFFPRLNTL